MSTTAPAPALGLDAPLPVAPEYGLLSVPGVLSVEDRGRWQAGVNLLGIDTEDNWTWDPCSSGTFRVKPEDGALTTARFDSFGLGMTLKCSSLGLPRDFDDRLEAVIDAISSFLVEKAISQGSEVTSNPSLGDSNLDVLASGATVSADVGLAWLENAIGATGLRGIIHAPPAVTARWGFNKLRTNGHLETVQGTYVASGGGYIGADPVAGDTADAGESWAFATAGVEVRLTPIDILSRNRAESMDRSTNEVVIRAERYALVTWDAELLQAGVLIGWGT